MTSRDEDFIAAVRTGDLTRVNALLAADPACIRTRHHGASALLIARYYGQLPMVALLRSRLSALDVFEAAALGEEKRVAELLDGDPALANAVAEDGFGPLGLAAFFDHEPVVRLLLARGAHVDTPASNHMRVMPLHSAAAAHSVPIAQLLLAHGAPVNARQGEGDRGFTPLMEAAFNGQVEMVDLLLAHGADPGLRDEKNLSAADHARARGHAALAERLR
ncbi:MAG TPA: ankyrin repeat domain-containing protein [Methylomirabilota bacterium]